MEDPARYIVSADAAGNLSIEVSGRQAIQHKYVIRKESLSLPFGREIPAILNDLVDLALTVYAVDRFVRRQSNESGDWWWQRCFDVHVPVADPDRWNEKETIRLLKDALDFLTEDEWNFRFQPHDKAPERASVQRVFFPPESPSVVALFSGGLDSFAGMALRLAEGDLHSIVALACSTNPRLLKKQQILLRALNGRTQTCLMPVFVRPGLIQQGHSYNLNERSQRARGFLFNTLGAVGAVMARASELLVYENGIGSINLRLSEAQLGAQSTRATHPVALHKMERFLSKLLGRELHLRLPFVFSTKGQMCEVLGESPFRALAVKTISCDGFPRREVGPEQCGVCTSCLLRRQALWSAGIAEDCDEGQYRHDVLGDMRSVPEKKLAPLWDMLLQADRLGCAIRSATPWQNLSIEYPELQEVRDVLVDWQGSVTKASVEQRIVDLYRNYCSEWERFPAYPPGWSFSEPGLRLTA